MLWLFACRPEIVEQTAVVVRTPDTSIDPQLTFPSDQELVDAGCKLDPDNALRALCSVTTSPPSPVEIEWTSGELAVAFSDDAVAEVHEVPIWGLTADAVWDWTARVGATTRSGRLRTGPLPDPVAFTAEVTPAGPTAGRMILLPASCGAEGYVVALDFEGRVRWYQDLLGPNEATPGRLTATQLGDDDTVAGIVEQEHLVRVDLTGRVLQQIWPGLPPHHDVFRRDGVTWTFLADEHLEADGISWVEDQVVGFDDQGAMVARWDEHDHLDATKAPPGQPGFWSTEFPGAVDAWHSNGLYVTAEGDFLVSLHRVSAILRVGRDGAIQWQMAGGGPFPSDFAFTDGGDRFEGQHDPALIDDTHLTVFDNGAPRGLELELDLDRRTASAVGEWPMKGPNCGIQGSVFPLPDGHWLVTCAGEHQIVEFDAQGARVTQIELSCPQGVGLPLTVRGQPVDLWDASVGSIRALRPQLR